MRAFVESIRSASEIREQSEAKKLKAALKHQEKRYAELDILLKKVYEDNALGRLPDKRYEMLSAGYEKEQAELEQSIKACREQLTQYDEDTDRTEEFLALVHKYTDITELTPVIINEFVDKILVHKAEKLLMADNDTHIAEVVAGENKVYVDTGIFPTAEEVKEKYAI